MTASEALPRGYRLAAERDIRNTLRTGNRRQLPHLEVIWTPNLAGHPRMGLIVPRFRFSAVARNRLRRRLREIWRRNLRPRQGEIDLVIRARREAYSATFNTLREQLLDWGGPISGTPN